MGMQTNVGWSWSFYGVGYYCWSWMGAWDLAVKKEEKDQEKSNSFRFK